MTLAQGIPEKIDLEYARRWVEPRISAKRFRHTEGVALVARRIARACQCDENLAELAGLLHDACKETKDKELVEQARAYGLILHPVEERNGHLLHGPVAAELVKKELGITNAEVLSAIAEHTLGNVPMSKLSEVLFLADCLEEGRPADYTAPIWAALSINKKINVAAAMVTASDLGLSHLIESGRPIHPRTVEVRNYYLARLKD